MLQDNKKKNDFRCDHALKISKTDFLKIKISWNIINKYKKFLLIFIINLLYINRNKFYKIILYFFVRFSLFFSVKGRPLFLGFWIHSDNKRSNIDQKKWPTFHTLAWVSQWTIDFFLGTFFKISSQFVNWPLY